MIVPGEDDPGTCAEYDVENLLADGGYARWSITDAQGRSAWSNPIYF